MDPKPCTPDETPRLQFAASHLSQFIAGFGDVAKTREGLMDQLLSLQLMAGRVSEECAAASAMNISELPINPRARAVHDLAVASLCFVSLFGRVTRAVNAWDLPTPADGDDVASTCSAGHAIRPGESDCGECGS